MNPYSLIDNALDIFDNNIHAGRENITLTFDKPSGNSGVDADGNARIINTQVVLKGRAKEDGAKGRETVTAGGDSTIFMLRVNLTMVDGIVGGVLPENIRPGDIAIANYIQEGSNQSYVGQFYVKPSASYSIPKIYEKVGAIIFGKFEVTGPGT